jgi:hypothetical protein
MLLLLIPTTWIAVAAFFVILCQMAGRADAELAEACAQPPVRTSLGELVTWERTPLLAARMSTHAARFGGPTASTRASARAGAVRDPDGRCAAQH